MKPKIGARTEFEGVPMFDIPDLHLRCRPLDMAFLGVRSISLLLEERAPFEEEQIDAYWGLLCELEYHVKKNQPFLRNVDNRDLAVFFTRADFSSERGLGINDLLLGRRATLDG